MTSKPSGFLVVTGSDTGVGKTVVSTLLCRLARQLGKKVIGIKPFSSGDRNDAIRLLKAVGGKVEGSNCLDSINPWHFTRPVAPCIAATACEPLPRLKEVCDWILLKASSSQLSVVEGAGGLLSPLGVDYTVMEVGLQLKAQFICVINNKIGAINQARLCYEVLKGSGAGKLLLVLNQAACLDESSASNELAIADRCPGATVVRIPHLTDLHAASIADIEESFLGKTLADLGLSDKPMSVLCEAISRSAS